MVKLCIALIHNHNKDRIDYIIPHLEELKIYFNDKGFELHYAEIGYQPLFSPHNTQMLIFRDILYLLTNVRWSKYRLIKLYLLRSIFSFIGQIFNGRYSKKSDWLNKSAIEVMLTDKHVRAWNVFLETNSDFLVVFEDDAIFKIDSKQKLYDLILNLNHMNLDNFIYCDLAGGCELDLLNINKLESHKDLNFRYYHKPVTNSACSYVLNKSLAVKFHHLLIKKPHLRLIGVDWMMNSLFMGMKRSYKNFICMHSDPTIFDHGSFVGKYISLIRSH